MLPGRRCRLAPGSPSLNVGVGQALQLAAQVLAQLVHLDLADLGVGLRGFDQRGGERLVGGEQLRPGLGTVGRAAQGERLVLQVLGERLDATAIGVRLTPHCMMIPRKSVTFALAIGESPVQLREANVCEFCGMVDCRFRHTTHKCFGGKRSDE